MNYAKISGWILLVVGLVIIGWTLLTSYNIFTVKADFPEVFETPQQETAVNKSGVLDIQAQMQEMVNEQLKGFLPVGYIARLFNLASWSILAFILVFGGTQISSLGIKLIKK